MVLKRSFTVFALAALLVAAFTFTFALATPVSAESPMPGNAELCRLADEAGELDYLGGLTRGECIKVLEGNPASENATNIVAAVCGSENAQAFFGTTNKGQCIKLARVFL